MEKLTLSIRDKKKIDWAKSFVKMNNTSLSQLFEAYLDEKEIERHLKQRRKRTAKASDPQ
jgi:hypothetical protein